MDCPFCNTIMKTGKIYGDRYDLKWVDGDRKLVMGMWAPEDSIVLSDNNSIQRPFVSGYICKKCGKIIIDVNGR